MANENKEVFPVKDPSVFKSSPNITADLLEQTLGIDFSLKPVMVELTLGNKLRLIREGVIPFSKYSAYYDHEYHTYFAKKNADITFTGLHENSHGYIALNNPKFRIKKQDLRDIVKWRKGSSIVSPKAVNEIVALRCFDEGLAQWSALRAATLLPHLFTQEDVQRYALIGFDDYHQGETYEQYIHRKQAQLKTNLTILTDSLTEGSLNASRRALASLSLIWELTYQTGYYYVLTLIRRPLRRGTSTADRINDLISNPPLTIEQIVNP